MAETLKFGNGEWATKKGSTLAYNDEGGNFKPLPFTFDRSTSATRVNKEGLIEVVSNNEPRIDFLNDSKGALLLEPSRTNNLLQSNQFDTTWSTSNATVTGGQIGVGGSTDAWLLNSSSGFILQTLSLSGVSTMSIYAKKGTAQGIRVRIDADTDANCYIDLSNGNELFPYTGTNLEVINVGNDWYRISLSIDSNISNVRLYAIGSDALSTSGTVYIQYAQLEQGSYATSYIPTQGQSGGVTRVAEQGIDGGAGTPIFSNTSAIWFIDLERIGVDTDSSGSAMALRNSSFSQQIRLHFDAPTTNIRFRDGLASYATISTITGMSAGVRKKIALRIDGSALSTFANGSKIGSDYTAPSTFDIDEIDFSTLGFKIHDMRFYNEALTDQELINLTTI